MKEGFDFLKTRPLQQSLSAQELETMERLNLPPLYKLFQQTFVTGKDTTRVDQYMGDTRGPNFLGCAEFALPNDDDLCLIHFLAIEDIAAQFQGAQYDEEWDQRRLLRIGLLGQVGFGGLYVGCGEDNFDQIWRFGADDNIKYLRLCDNIFEFVRGLIFSYDFSNLDRSEYHRLYKTWDAPHWRLRETANGN